jgi:O-antigen ligase
LLGFFGWVVLAAVFSNDRDLAFAYVEELVKIVVPVVVAITLIDSVAKLKQLVWVIVLSVGYVALELNLDYLHGYNRIREEGFAGLDNNGVAIVLNCCVGLTIFLGLSARAWWQRLLALGTALVLIHGVLLSNSRAGILALGVTALVSLWILPKKAWHYFAFALIVLVGFRLAGDDVRARFTTILKADSDQQDGSVRARKRLLFYALDSVGRQPILGVGPNQWNKVVKREYGIPDGKATEVHNTWIQIAAEVGVPGLAMILLYYGICAIRLVPIARSRDGESTSEFADLARMAVSSIAASIVACSFVSVEAVEAPYYIALLGAGILKVSSSGCRSASPVETMEGTA